MPYDIPVRLAKLRKKYVDVIRELRSRNITVNESQFSRYVNDIDRGPKSKQVLAETNLILMEWEDLYDDVERH